MELQTRRGSSSSALTASEACAQLNVDPSVGLSSVEAAQRLAIHGPNCAQRL